MGRRSVVFALGLLVAGLAFQPPAQAAAPNEATVTLAISGMT